MSRRAGLALGGSLFVYPNRTLALGLEYAHADLDRVESPPGSVDVVAMEHAAHTLMAEARVVPLRFSAVSVFATIGAGLAWQTASTRATLPPRDGSAGGSFSCDVAAGADFAFRAGLGAKARLSRAASLLLGVDFVGYRFTTDLLDGCAFGAGTAQTLVIHAGVTYDLDISGLVR
jgi:opacity protein-like surface antigen